MKKFKHKKTGETAEEYPDYYRTRYWQTVNDIPKRLVEDSSDWEEIIPKEWEILSFVDRGRVLSVVDNIAFNGKLLECLSNYPIRSVKRLSDGVIFTLGDIILNGSNYVISSITVEDNEALLWVEDDYCSLSIECAKKVELLHTTKDGYKINTGDKYFIVENFRIREVVGGTFTKSKWDDFRFKGRENAENWILYNKPCLSLNDVMQRFTVRNINCDELEELIKTRL